MTRRLPLIMVATAALATLLAAVPADAKLEGKAVKLGAIYSMTGKGAEWGEHSKVATEIAVEEINAAGGIGGIPVEIVITDTATEVGQAITLARRLILEDKVLAVLGPCFSSEFEALAPQLVRLKTIILSQCSAKPGLGKLSEWAFRNTLTSDKQLDPATRIWKERYKIKTAAILYDSADAVSAAEGSKVLPALFKKHGISVKETLTYQTKDIDFSAQLTKIKAAAPDGIALGACYQQAANIVRQARKLGLTQPFLAGACTGSPEFAEIVGKDGEGSIIGSAGWPDDPAPRMQSLMKKFVARAGKKSNYGGLRSYDNVYILKMVIERSSVTNRPGDLESDRARIREGLAKLDNYDGVVGPISFDEHGDGSGKPTVLVVKDGKFQKVEY
ncbi:MAG TPA: ABC transporter substrate-binding protein [Methylomirabilota bacterium]|nr:ABC transporter substrate-binding protein [Methylomirabilota bacterium]